jgi:hypothetical protein
MSATTASPADERVTHVPGLECYPSSRLFSVEEEARHWLVEWADRGASRMNPQSQSDVSTQRDSVEHRLKRDRAGVHDVTARGDASKEEPILAAVGGRGRRSIDGDRGALPGRDDYRDYFTSLRRRGHVRGGGGVSASAR